jgi:WD40 repeat protein
MGLAFWPDGKTLASYGSDKTLRLWNIDLGKEIARNSLDSVDHGDPFSPDGKMLVKHCHDPETRACYQVELLDVPTGKLKLALPRQQHQVYHAAFSHYSRAIALLTDVGNIYVYDVSNGQKRSSIIAEKGS